MTVERPEQRRGIPYVAAMIEQIKQLDRYLSSELAASIVHSMLTVFITTEEPDDGEYALPDGVKPGEKVTDEPMKIVTRAVHKSAVCIHVPRRNAAPN